MTEIKVKEWFPSSSKLRLDRLKVEAEHITTMMKEGAYLDTENLKELAKKLETIRNEIFILEL